MSNQKDDRKSDVPDGGKPEEGSKAAASAESEQDTKEQLLRLAAEFDNYKKRTRKDVENAKGIGAAELARDLLPILDEFYIAMVAAEKSQDKTLLKGFEMLYSNLLETLKRKGLKEVDCKGTYNPYIHEIVMTREEPKAKPGTIVEVMKKGYMLGEVLLRPASVIVAAEAKVQNKEDESESEEKNDNA